MLKNHISWIVLFILFLHRQCCAHLITMDLISRNASLFCKVWHKYVDKSNYNALVRGTRSKLYCFVSFLSYYAEKYSSYQVNILKLKNSCSDETTNTNSLIGRICDNTGWIKKQPLSTQKIYHVKEQYPRDKERCARYINYFKCRKMSLSFNLHQMLLLNLTLTKVDIELTYKCVNEYIGTGNNKEAATKSRICGHMPTTSKFLEPQHTILVQITLEWIPHRIEIQFQVVDPKHIKQKPCCTKCGFTCYHFGSLSKQVPENHLTRKPLAYFYPVFGNMFRKLSIQIFHLQGKRYLLLGVETKIQSLFAYDGPYMSQTLSLKSKNIFKAGELHSSYLSSTFQITLKAVQNYSHDNSFPANKHMTYFIQAPHLSKCKVTSKSKTITLDMFASFSNSCTGCTECFRNIMYCVFEFFTGDHSSVNLSVDYMKYNGPNIDSCR